MRLLPETEPPPGVEPVTSRSAVQFWAIPHLFERLFFISWENNRDCHITMPLSKKTMECRLKGTTEIRGLERFRFIASFAFTGF